jgi:DNA-directed RNA polymerase specialized sigma24 family protein
VEGEHGPPRCGEAQLPPEPGAGATLGEIYDAYNPFVFDRIRRGCGNRDDAKDLHQDVFLHLAELIDLWDQDREVVAEALGCTVASLRVQLHRARSAFYKIAATLAGEALRGAS